MVTKMPHVLCYFAGTQVFSPGPSGLDFEKNPLCMFERTPRGFSSALKESGSFCQNSTTGSLLCSVFISRESRTSESYYCAYFEALLCKHMDQADEVHFTVRL